MRLKDLLGPATRVKKKKKKEVGGYKWVVDHSPACADPIITMIKWIRTSRLSIKIPF